MLVNDDLQLNAPGPPQVTGLGAQVVGTTGMRRYWYWVVTHYPIGISVTGPVMVSNAPDILTTTNLVNVIWNPAIGATSYDVLRADTPQFPMLPGNYAVAQGLSQPGFNDNGGNVSAYSPGGLTYGAPATRRIYLNNRDYTQPMIELDAVRTPSITFPDGSTLTSGIIQPPAAGSAGQVQFNNGGLLGASPNLVWDGANLVVSNINSVAGQGLTMHAASGQNTDISGNGIALRYQPSGSVQVLGSDGNYHLLITDSYTVFQRGSVYVDDYFRIRTPDGSTTVLDTNPNNGNMTMSGQLILTNLPSTAPGAGSKRLWYDPADGNRVKFAA